MDLSSEDTKKDWFTAWMAIGKSMKDASDKGEKISLAKVVFNSIKNYNLITQQQKTLTDGTSTDNTRTAIED